MKISESSYDEEFYQARNDGSYKSAVCYADQLLKLMQPSSVVDVGCGRGAWLKAFKEKGVKNLKGIDGSWNKQELMLEPEIREALENPSHPRENTRVIAGADWVHGQQAARIR